MVMVSIAHAQPYRRFQAHSVSFPSYLRLSSAQKWHDPHFAPPRLDVFRLRCSFTNTDVSNSVATEEVYEDTTSLDSDCSIPAHLQSDTLETEGLNLLGAVAPMSILEEGD